MIHSNGYVNGMHARWRSQNPNDQNRARRKHGPRKGNNDRHPCTGPIVCIDPGIIARSRDYWSKCVLGYIVDYRKFSTFAIKRIFENQWLCHGNIIIHRMGDIFALHFEDEQDQAGILARTVACFDGALMVFQRWIHGMVPRAVRFPHANLWVRICGLPFEYLNKGIAYTVGHILGHSFEVSPFDHIPGNDYLRIRVCMCLGEPLIPGFFLTCDDGYLLWIQFRYEEVFKYCVRCGRVGHVGVNCTENGEDIETDIKDSLQRINNRGFVISQAEKSHTMFDLDLRALPSTTKFISSKIRLSRNEGFSVPVDFFEEQVVDFQLGVTPGGRIRPGMRFQNNTQPFSGVVVGHSEAGLYRAPMDVEHEDDSFNEHEDDRANILGMERDVFENGVERNSSSTEDRLNGDEAQPLNGEPDLPVEIGLVEQVEHSFVEQDNENQWFILEDPLVGAMGHRQPVAPYDENALIQTAFRRRVEQRIDEAFREDEDGGYNQVFDSPNGGPVVGLEHDRYNILSEGFEKQNVEVPQHNVGMQNGGEVGSGTGGWTYDISSDESLSYMSPKEGPILSLNMEVPSEFIPVQSSSSEFVDARNTSSDTVVISSDNNCYGNSLNTVVLSNEIEGLMVDGTSEFVVPNVAETVTATNSHGEQEVVDEWERGLFGNERMSEDGSGKRKAESDPKTVIIPEHILNSEENTLSFFRSLDKKLRPEVTPGRYVDEQGNVTQEGEGESFYTSLRFFDLENQKRQASLFDNDTASGESTNNKEHEKLDLVKRSVQKADGDKCTVILMTGYDHGKVMAEASVLAKNVKTWTEATKKRRAVSDPKLALVPDCVLTSVT